MRIRASHNGLFTTVLTEGGLLPSDFLQRLTAGDKSIEGLNPEAYHLNPNQKLNEVISDSWNAVLAAWKNFQEKKDSLGESETGTTETRERWLQHLFKELGYGRLLTTKPFEIEGKKFEISHQWQKTPIHLISFKAPLDKRSEGIVGAARSSPHSLVQEFLNRSDDHLWAFLSNGLKLRILRDNVSLIRQAYIEFDLEAMLNGQVYPDFVLLWLLCHQSRVEAERPEVCWLEKWTQSARQQGARALEDLRIGVQTAIEALGSGFLSSPVNTVLKEKLRSGTLTPQEYYRQLLRIVYRFIFLFVAEDRDVLLVPSSSDKAKNTYVRYYSTKRLRALSTKLSGTKHADLWLSLQLIFKKLGTTGSPELALPALGSFLWSDSATPDLLECNIANRDLLKAIRNLSFTEEDKIRRPVDYKNLGMKELGSVYEALLEQHPRLNIDSSSFELNVSAGNERKTTGSYYTDDSLVESLLDSALNPVLDEASKKSNPEEAILNLKVCDPGTGSGHFLIAAAHRMAKRLAAIRTGEDEPSPEALRTALRDVISHCIYGVDINPMAVELCKFTLWLEAMDPTKPLTFLDHHIKCGNSLLGTTPALLKQGIPDEAFEPIEGDDKKYCQLLKKRNKTEKLAVHSLFDDKGSAWLDRIENVRTQMEELSGIQSANLEEVHKQENLLEQIQHSSTYQAELLHANAWCAAFVQEKKNDGRKIITEDWFRQIESDPDKTPKELKEEIERIATQYQFFHWHLAFPEVFRVSMNISIWEGGFDVLLGNPPWERIKLQEKEWFSEKMPDIARARSASERKRMIDELREKNPLLYNEFSNERRKSEGEGSIIRESGRYPLCGRGDVNTYAVFAELFMLLLDSNGYLGIVVPSGIATDDTTKHFFKALMNKNTIVSLYDFDNGKGLFPIVHRQFKFCLLTICGKNVNRPQGADFVFFAQTTNDLKDHDRQVRIKREDIKALNPDSETSVVVRSKRDYELLIKMHANCCRLEGPEYQGYYIRLIHLSDHAKSVYQIEDLSGGLLDSMKNYITDSAEYLRVYEAKLFFLYNHRYSTFEGVAKNDVHEGKAREVGLKELSSADFVVTPRYWVNRKLFEEIMSKYSNNDQWLLGYRDITNTTNERTSVATALPKTPTTVSIPCIGIAQNKLKHLLLANLSSFCLDFIARQKVPGSHLTYGIMKQLPLIPPDVFEGSCPWDTRAHISEFITDRLVELVYCAYDMHGFAEDLGVLGNPYCWDVERRFVIRSEIDATFFHLYHIEKVDVDYIMDTFPIVRRRDEDKYGEYRTKRVISEIYDEMAEAIRTGVPYKTRLDPPPADPRVAHSAKEEIALEQLRWLVILRAITEIERQKKKDALKVYSVKILYIAEVCKQIAQQYPWTLQQHGPYPEAKLFDSVLDQMQSKGLITIGRIDSQLDDLPIRPTEAGTNYLSDLEAKFNLSDQRQIIQHIVNDFKQYDGRDMELRATLIFIQKNNPKFSFDQIVSELMKIKQHFRAKTTIEQVLTDLIKLGYVADV